MNNLTLLSLLILLTSCTTAHHLTDSKSGWFNIDQALASSRFYYCRANEDANTPKCYRAEMVDPSKQKPIPAPTPK